MIVTYKILSLLLDYPSRELRESLADIVPQLRKEQYLDEFNIGRIEAFVDYATLLPLTRWQEQYVALFDQGSGTNLYLFDHVYGSSRDRGQAMVDLKDMYTQNGFIPCEDELPDYLPLFLEFLAAQSDMKRAELLLAEPRQVLAGMLKQMEKHQTPYVFLIEVVSNLARKEEIGTNTVVGAEKGETR